ncbi:MAG: hypothetical protein GY805_29680 [Chloroflexi bacterium]|nr:hypothetical protein [Chloroflexota bacterium]
MKRKLLLLTVILFMTVGCTAVTTVEETAVPNQPATNMPEENELETDSTEAQHEEPAMSNPQEIDPTPTDDDSKQVSEPVTVDLSAVTPVSIDSTPVVQPTPGNPGVNNPVLLAVADLSGRLSVSADEIELVSLQEVTWRDGSLGCPQAGMNYFQVLSPGQQMILRANGQDYHYHSGKGGIFNFCSNPQPPIENIGINPNQPPPPGKDD